MRSGRNSETAARLAIRGFTLIEVLVALVILSTGIVLVLRAFETALTASVRARDSMLATLLLRDKLSQVEASLQLDRIVEPSGRESFTEGENAGFRRMFTVASFDAHGDALLPAQGALYEVRVTVSKAASATEQTAATYVFVPPRKQKPDGAGP